MKIEEGMYVRTRNGIAKILGKVNDPCNYYYKMLITDKFLKIHDDTEYINDLDVIKASYNIIDLIEEGDYVNGYKVSFKDKDYKPFVQCDYPVQCGTTNHYRFYEEGIKDIVTKEQFESMKYEVK